VPLPLAISTFLFNRRSHCLLASSNILAAPDVIETEQNYVSTLFSRFINTEPPNTIQPSLRTLNPENPILASLKTYLPLNIVPSLFYSPHQESWHPDQLMSGKRGQPHPNRIKPTQSGGIFSLIGSYRLNPLTTKSSFWRAFWGNTCNTPSLQAPGPLDSHSLS
jgi:hypothetical protein